MFIDADGDGKTYVELQANPRGVTFDSYLATYRKNENDWDPPGFRAAVKVDGTLDKRDDTDKGWVVEMVIPLEAAMGKLKEMKNVPPKVGTEWRVNFFRLDMPAGRPQVGVGWSPPLVGDFHALDRFGFLTFGDEKGTAPNYKPDAKPGATVEEKKPEPAPAGADKKPEKAAVTPATPAVPDPTKPRPSREALVRSKINAE
jgi:hypothetical protein